MKRQRSRCIINIGSINTATPIWAGREDRALREGIMNPDDLARVIVMMSALPPELNMLESILLPVSMPFLGRG